MDVLIKIFRFGIVGLTGMVLDFAITWVLKEKLTINKYIANIMGFVVAAINNFYINYIWTFNASSTNMQLDFVKFFVFALIGLALNSALLFLFHEKYKVHFYLAKALAIICVFAWNFTTNYFFNFHS